MKKAFFFFLLATFTSLLYAQESFSAGAGFQINNYSSAMFGAGGLVTTDFRFNELISLGSGFLFSYDAGNGSRASWEKPMTVMELSVNARWYFLRFKSLVDWFFEWQNYLHWFVQFETGFSVIGVDGKNMVTSQNNIPFMLGVSAGVRIMIGNMYVEPYIRGGEPYMWGAGLIVGGRITGKE
ncbi:MAG: hypothetical protein LBC53_01930 [Spirochaetaceae bacterium]|nr:hypothetical protein [Spirochaetaceae bacterium]